VSTRPATPPPSPTAADGAAFIAELRQLKVWSGLSFRQLERRAAAAGYTLPASTTATMLGRSSLPREELLAAFVRACGLSDLEAHPWLTARAMIADGTKAAVQPVPNTQSGARTSSRWRMAIVAAAALSIAFASGAAVAGGVETTSNIEHEEVTAAWR
jgi:hypothetical protein